MRTAILLAAMLLPFVTQLTAQDEVLAVEKREDQKGRDAVMRLLKATRTNFVAEAMTPKDCCRALSTLAGDKVNFLFAAKGEAAAAPAFDVLLKSASLWSVMSAVQQLTGLRFVYRDGVVFLLGKDQLRPLTYLQVYDLRGQVTPLRSFPGPKLGLLGAEEGDQVLYPPEEESGTTVSGYTAEGIEEIIKTTVTPELWGGDSISLSNTNGLLLIRHTAAGQQQIRELFYELGLMSPPRLLLPKTPSPKPLQRPRVRQ